MRTSSRQSGHGREIAGSSFALKSATYADCRWQRTCTFDSRERCRGGELAKEKVRERVAGTPSADYFRLRGEAGWKLVAVEWERETDAPPPQEEEVPYGMRVGRDCAHLEYEPAEMAVMTLIMELIIQEHAFSRIAEELNRAGFKRRSGEPWSPISVFNLLPRLIEVGQRMFSTAEWPERRQRIYALMGKRHQL